MKSGYFRIRTVDDDTLLDEVTHVAIGLIGDVKTSAKQAAEELKGAGARVGGAVVSAVTTFDRAMSGPYKRGEESATDEERLPLLTHRR